MSVQAGMLADQPCTCPPPTTSQELFHSLVKQSGLSKATRLLSSGDNDSAAISTVSNMLTVFLCGAGVMLLCSRAHSKRRSAGAPLPQRCTTHTATTASLQL